MAPPSGDRDKPGKLYLGGLSFSTEEDKLKSVFQKYGKIAEVQIIKDKLTSISRGFGFVTYENAPDADDAVGALDGLELDGKYIKVAHAMKSKSASGDSRPSDSRPSDSRPSDRGGRPSPSSRGGGSGRGRGSRDPFEKQPPWAGGSYYESQKSTTSPRDSRGRERGGSYMDSGRGRGGSYRGRGRGGPPRSLMDRGDDEFASGRGPALLTTPLEPEYGREEDSLYAPRAKATGPPPRSSRFSPYAREDDLDARRPAAPSPYGRKSRFGPTVVYEEDPQPYPGRIAPEIYEDIDAPERSARPLDTYAAYDGLPAAREARLPASSYGREPDSYGSLSSERASRAPLASYDREPAAYGREAPVYGREESAYDRQSSYPPERGAAPAVLDDPYAPRSREPALSDYPSSRPLTRDYPPSVERPAARAELPRDPYARDPYAPLAREPAVARDYERGRELPPAAPRERDPYGRPAPATAREPAPRAGLMAGRGGPEASEYDRPQLSREFPSERNGTYVRERESRDPYAATAGTSRYESYPPARDAYASAPLSEKPAYGAPRDPYGAAPAGRNTYSRR